MLNEGAYDQSDFGYTDPHPSSFHPLGGDATFAAVRRDELACLFGGALAPFEVEDQGAWDGRAPAPMPLGLTDGLEVFDAKTGDVDGDGRPELVVLGIGGGRLAVRVGRRDGSGWSVEGSFALGGGSEAYRVGHLDLGDVDGDGRAEIVVSATFGSYTRAGSATASTASTSGTSP